MKSLSIIVILALCQVCFASYEVVQVGRLPSKRSSTKAIFDGEESIYVVGGMSLEDGFEYFDDILRFNLGSGDIKKIGNFPTSPHQGALGSDGNGTYFLVGNNGAGSGASAIYTFTKTDHSPKLVRYIQGIMSLPQIVSDGAGVLYITQINNWYDDDSPIYYMNTTDLGVHVATISSPNISCTASAWVGDSQYCFGKRKFYDREWHGVFKFTPETNEVKSLNAGIPFSYGYSAVAAGTDIYIVGGGQNSENCFQFIRFNTLTGGMKSLEVTNYTRELYDQSAVYVPETNRIYVFGGRHDLYGDYDEIFYIQL